MSKLTFGRLQTLLAILALFGSASTRASLIGDEYNVQKSFADADDPFEPALPLEDTVLDDKEDLEDDPIDEYVKVLDESVDDTTDDENEKEAEVRAYRIALLPTPIFYWPEYLVGPNERLGFGEHWFPTKYGQRSHFYPIGEGIYRSKRSIDKDDKDDSDDELSRTEKGSEERSDKIRDRRSLKTKGKIFSQSLPDQIRSKEKRQGRSFRKWIEKKAGKLRKKLEKKLSKKGLLRNKRAATDTIKSRHPRSLKRWLEKKKDKLRAKWAAKLAKKSDHSSYYRRFPNFPYYRTRRDVKEGEEPEEESTKRGNARQQPFWNHPYNPYNPYNPYEPYNPYNPYNSYNPSNPYNPYAPFDPYNPYGLIFEEEECHFCEDEEIEIKNNEASENNDDVEDGKAVAAGSRGLLSSLVHGISHALDRPSYYQRPSNYYRPGYYYGPQFGAGGGFGYWRSAAAAARALRPRPGGWRPRPRGWRPKQVPYVPRSIVVTTPIKESEAESIEKNSVPEAKILIKVVRAAADE